MGVCGQRGVDRGGVVTRLLLLSLLACHSRIIREPQVLNITYKPVLPSCYITDMPEPPALLEVNTETEDIVRRVFVHFLQYNEALAWMHDAQLWMSEVRGCLYVMQGVEP
jgi:hypothetical protein